MVIGDIDGEQGSRVFVVSETAGLVEEDGYAEAGEFGGAGGMAGAYGGGMVFAGVESLCDFVGEVGDVGHFVPENSGGFGASPTSIEFASLARVGGAGSYVKIVSRELRGDLLLLFVQRKRKNRSGEIFDGEKHVTGLDDGDSDGVQIRSEKVGAVRGRVHPLRVDADDGGTLGDIFGNGAEACSGLARAVLHGRLAGKLVRELIHLGHAQGVLMGSGGQRGIPTQRRQARSRAIAIGGVQQSLVSGTGLRRRSVERGNEE